MNRKIPYGYQIQNGELIAQAGNVPFQYAKLLDCQRGADDQPEIVPEEAEIVKRIYRRYLDGCSLAQIKTELEADGVPASSGIQRWTYQVVRNILTNEKYIGDALLQKTYTAGRISKTVKKNQGERPMVYVEKNHPAIVSKAMFYQVREEMARRSSKRKVMQKSGKTEQGKYSAKYALFELLDLAGIVQQGRSADGIDPLTLRGRLDALTAQQAELLDKALEDMDNPELNAQLKALAEEKQDTPFRNTLPGCFSWICMVLFLRQSPAARWTCLAWVGYAMI